VARQYETSAALSSVSGGSQRTAGVSHVARGQRDLQEISVGAGVLVRTRSWQTSPRPCRLKAERTSPPMPHKCCSPTFSTSLHDV